MLYRFLPPVDVIRDELANIYKRGVCEDNKTVEITGVQFVADAPSIFGAPNEEYIKREFTWYLGRHLNVNKFRGKVPEIWKQVADPAGNIHSNYGYLVYDAGNHFQFQHAFRELKVNPATRRAVIHFNRPSIVDEFRQNGMNDYICTYCYQFFIRDGRLDMLVYMRSNDAVYGYPNDVAWAKFVHKNMYDALVK